jgi:hypothetical protein
VGAVEVVVRGEKDVGDRAGSAGKGEWAEMVGSRGPGGVGLAPFDVGGSGGADDGVRRVLAEDAIGSGGVSGEVFQVDVEPRGVELATGGRDRGGAELGDESCSELAAGTDDEDF